MSGILGFVVSEWLVVGKFTSSYGIKGWIKIHSFTDPIDNIGEYDPLYIRRQDRWEALEVERIQRHAKGLIAKVKGCDNRESTPRYCGSEIGIEKKQLPLLGTGDFYWSDLEGLTVKNQQGEVFGAVEYLIETGANDVLVVKATDESIDDQERLIPYLVDQTVVCVDTQAGIITVDWDADF